MDCEHCAFMPLRTRPWPLGPLFLRRKHFPRASGASGLPVERPARICVTFIAEQDGRWIGLATGLITGSPDPILVGMFVDGSGAGFEPSVPRPKTRPQFG
jgi:hypothetical protein